MRTFLRIIAFLVLSAMLFLLANWYFGTYAPQQEVSKHDGYHFKTRTPRCSHGG